MQASTTLPTYETLPGTSRVWIYKSATPFTPEQKAVIKERGDAFTGRWRSHGQTVLGALEFMNDHFIVLAADIQDMSLCGGAIDASTRMIRKVEQELGIGLTDRMVVVYERDGALHTCHVNDLAGMIQAGTIDGDTVVYNDLLQSKAELDKGFRVPLRDTWMKRFL